MPPKKQKSSKKDKSSKNRKNHSSKKKSSTKQKNKDRYIILHPDNMIGFSNVYPGLRQSVLHNNSNNNSNSNNNQVKRQYHASSSSQVFTNHDGEKHHRSRHMETDGKKTIIETDVDGKRTKKVIRHSKNNNNNNNDNRNLEELTNNMYYRMMPYSRHLYHNIDNLFNTHHHQSPNSMFIMNTQPLFLRRHLFF